jgi:hypothetical protein
MNQKKMTPEAAAQLDQVERIVAHVDDNYELLEDDLPYFEQLTQCFRMIHDDNDKESSRKKIKMMFPGCDHRKLLDDTVRVYGDFFIINRAAMRIIQEKRHQALYDAAIRGDDFATAERCLIAIDKLHRLYEKHDDMPATHRQLPKVRLTTDPKALETLKQNAKTGS